tara:strand:+ start:50 stop:586 length:537 start_codon:yes stop_codon:yes gene_type:complete
MGNDTSRNLASEYLAAIRDTQVYKEAFSRAYQNPKEAVESISHYPGILSSYGKMFETERSAQEPYETNYSKAAAQLRQFITEDGPKENNPRDVNKTADGRIGRPLKNKKAVYQLAMAEALESHEQQGKRFVDTFGGSDVISGYPKSTRSMGQTVEPIQHVSQEKNTTDQTLMENMRKK